MFKKNYVGHHGYSTFVRGVWRIVDEEYRVKITAVGRPDDEFVVGQILSLEEIQGITNGDPYSYASLAAQYAVA